MPDLLAKGTAATVAFLLVMVVGILYFTSRPPAGATEVVAEFEDAFPLIEGMHVRVDGAIAGSVGPIEVNDNGNAEVTLILNDSVEPAMGDANAAIRQQDTTGDSYVSFDPGGESNKPGADEPLGEEGIVCTDHNTCPGTLVAPRLDDLLNAFGPAERAGVQLMLTELANTFDARGADLNAAALELKPAFEAANQALTEINSQNEALKALITSAEDVTGQAASRDQELASLVDNLAATTETTANQTPALDAALERLPETTTRARAMLESLTGAAVAGQPLADDVAIGAPGLATAIRNLPPFLEDAKVALEDTEPTLELTRELVRAAAPSLEVGKDRIVTGAFDLTGATADLLNAVLGGEDAFPALFDDDSYGEDGGTLGRRGFGAVAVEPGNLPGYPAEHASRNWLRVSAIINCEVFGVPVKPGCLADVLAGAEDAQGKANRSPKEPEANAPAPAERGTADPPAAPLPDLDLGDLDLPELDLERLDELPDLNLPLPDLGLNDLGRALSLGGPRSDRKQDRGKGSAAAPDRALSDLLNFLMR